LLQTQMPIKEIAFECGYISIGYFNQCFKQQNGISPKEYRSGKNKIETVAPYLLVE